MLGRLKEEILKEYREKRNIEELNLEVQIDIRDRLETLCAVERKILNESIRRNTAIKEVGKTIEGLPPQDDDAFKLEAEQ